MHFCCMHSAAMEGRRKEGRDGGEGGSVQDGVDEQVTEGVAAHCLCVRARRWRVVVC